MDDLRKDRRRAIRRHHKQRVKNRAIAAARVSEIWEPGPASCVMVWTDLHGRKHRGLLDFADMLVFRERWTHRAEHMCACSCWMCGNPRRHLKEKTWQELRSDADRAEQLRALGISPPKNAR